MSGRLPCSSVSPACLPRAVYGTHGVEKVGQHQGEDQQCRSEHAKAGESTEQVDGANDGQVRDATERAWHLGYGQGPAGWDWFSIDEGWASAGQGFHDHCDHGGGHNADEQAAAHIAGNQHPRNDQTDDEDEGRPGSDGAVDTQANGDGGASSVRDTAHETGIDQADHGDEQADTHAHGCLQRIRNGIKNRNAETRNGQQNNNDAVDND